MRHLSVAATSVAAAVEHPDVERESPSCGKRLSNSACGERWKMMRDSWQRIATKPRQSSRERDAVGATGSLVQVTAIRGHRVAGPSAAGTPTKAASRGRWIQRLAIVLQDWLERDAERRRLQSLNDHMLGDIG